ncbi:hypothetical protein [Noviherbaspirillum sp. Root189]|uniref:hypothetical protein n=1 Tax=Noviherbaspirillum sp. Root189 TaxID=1736487 RepID=UPI00070A4E26|nr:hypothetical protein [Noviherbaspirillum sp. Root189]KRB70493.1 hypothetical protein ASE07_07725 [Noviherbaspirillum sp. Root189]
MSAQNVAAGTMLMSQLLGSSSVASAANPYVAAANLLGSAAASNATSSADGNTFGGGYDHSGWNVNFGSGGITSSATREAASQWIGIAAGVVTLLVAFKMLKR